MLPPAPVPPLPTAPVLSEQYRRCWWFLGVSWLTTVMAHETYLLPLNFLLKDHLHCTAAMTSLFIFVGRFANYVKPVAGIFTDAVPLCGTRRRHYLLFSLAACALGWLIFVLIPRQYGVMLAWYLLLYLAIVFVSTTLGGVMAEAGARFHATGRLSAQRIAIFRIAALFGGPLGGWLSLFDFRWTGVVIAAYYLILIPLIYRELLEGPSRPGDVVVETDMGVEVFRNGVRVGPPAIGAAGMSATLTEMSSQFGVLLGSSTLWKAAGLVILIMVAPGFATPLLYYQTDTLMFPKTFVGTLKMVEGAGGITGALIFGLLCRRIGLRPLLSLGILLHCGGALLFLAYRSPTSALVITAIYWCGQTLAVLPLYDLAIRATPRGVEAMGYSVMMSVWNLTYQLSDVVGARLFVPLGFNTLLFLNAGTTALVLFFIPMLPKALTECRDQ